MADNVTLNSIVFKTKDTGASHVPFKALADVDGVAISDANPLPVEITDATIAVTQSGAWTAAQSGTWTVGLSAGANNVGKVTPEMTGGGNLDAQTAGTGTNWTAFASQACKQLCLVNNTGTKIEFRQDGTGVGVVIFDQTGFTIYGITNASQVGVRRVDVSNTQVTIQARWEA